MISSDVTAGFVLVGGKSSRMGRDKALLPFQGKPLVEHVAEAVRAAAGSLALIGNPAAYGHLGYPVFPDSVAAGPLGGICSALENSAAEWNLVLACDMPEVSPEFLSELLERAVRSEADCFLPAGPSGMLEPLCAAYHARCLAEIRGAIERGVRKITDGLRTLRMEIWRVNSDSCFRNINTYDEWRMLF